MNARRTILVADDELSMRQNLVELLGEEGYVIIEAADGQEALAITLRHHPDIVLLDINLPHLDGLTVLRTIKKELPDTVVIVFTAYGTSERAIEAMKAGAHDYLEKPFDLDEFLLIIRRSFQYRELLGEVRHLRSRVGIIGPSPVNEAIVGNSGKMQEIFKLIGRCAPTDTTVLIQGESGTGKELIADALQRHSLRHERPFIKVNCGALPESLLESEIFGHERGAFTGAVAMRPGRFELAEGGTIFLDEVNTMPPSLQVKLLRVLQNRTFDRVGGKETLTADVRVIAATNKDLEREVKEGRFREDLYYRLNILHISVPPLRDHPEDIPVFVDHFLRKYAAGRMAMVASEVMERFRAYSWPGNVRELENVVQRALVMAQGDIITPEDLPLTLQGEQDILAGRISLQDGMPLKKIIADVERELIQRALHESGGNQSKAARILHINRRQLFEKIRRFRIGGLLKRGHRNGEST
jgi:DNA-binding NtrC family response regulator